jgi:hypothetical protein
MGWLAINYCGCRLIGCSGWDIAENDPAGAGTTQSAASHSGRPDSRSPRLSAFSIGFRPDRFLS